MNFGSLYYEVPLLLEGGEILMNKYGNRIRWIREKNNDSMEDLAKKMNMSWSTLGKYERGERRITPELLEEVAKVYDVPLSYFYGEAQELPEALKKHGEGWVTFIKEMEQKELTPEQIKATLELLEKLGKI